MGPCPRGGGKPIGTEELETAPPSDLSPRHSHKADYSNMKVRVSIIMKWQDTGKESRLTAVVDHIKGYPEHFKLEALFFDESKVVRPLNVHNVVMIMQTISISLAAGDYEEFRM